MSRTVIISITLLVLLLVGGGIYSFLQLYERKERTIHTGFLGEARTNSLYASRLFLKRMGIPAETKTSIQGLTGFPNKNTVLIINSRRTSFSPRKTQALIDWVESGGHVIALATHNWRYNRSGDEKENSEKPEPIDKTLNPDQSPDPLQRAMGVKTGTKILYDDLNQVDRDFIDNIKETKDDFEIDTLFKLELEDVNKKLAIANTWYHPILIEKQTEFPTEIIKLRANNFIVRQKMGDGLITLVSSLEFIENKQIGKADHAEILWHLVHGLHKPLNQPASIWLITNDKISPLWEILWRNAWALILSLGIIFILWLLKISRRFGPLIPKLENNRRSLTEHISSSGQFYWKHDKQRKLLNATRKATLDRISKIHPNFNSLSDQEKVDLLHSQHQLGHSLLNSALFDPFNKQTDKFTQIISNLEHVRKTL